MFQLARRSGVDAEPFEISQAEDAAAGSEHNEARRARRTLLEDRLRSVIAAAIMIGRHHPPHGTARSSFTASDDRD